MAAANSRCPAGSAARALAACILALALCTVLTACPASTNDASGGGNASGNGTSGDRQAGRGDGATGSRDAGLPEAGTAIERPAVFYRDLAQVYLNHHDFDMAARLYRRSIELTADAEEKARGWHELAQALRVGGKPDQALDALGNAAEFCEDPIQKVRNHFLLGQVAEDLGQLDRAREAYKYVYQHAEKDYERKRAQNRLTAIIGKSEDVDGEISRLRAAVAGDPDDLVSTRILAETLRHRKDPEAALPLYERLRSAEPGDRETLQALGDLYRTTGRYREAVDLYQNMSDSFPSDRSYCLERISFVYASWGHKDKAAEYAGKIVEEGRGNLGAYIRAAQRYVEIGYYDQAEQVYAQAVALAGSPREKEDLQLQLAQVLRQADRLEAAAEVYRQIMRETRDERKKAQAQQFLRSVEVRIRGRDGRDREQDREEQGQPGPGQPGSGESGGK